MTTAAQGFAGPVAVTLTLDDSLTIQSIEIGDDQFAETDGLGAKAKDAEVYRSVRGQNLPLKDGDIDAISGATITTNAVPGRCERHLRGWDTGAPRSYGKRPPPRTCRKPRKRPRRTEAPEATEAPPPMPPWPRAKWSTRGTVVHLRAGAFAGPVACKSRSTVYHQSPSNRRRPVCRDRRPGCQGVGPPCSSSSLWIRPCRSPTAM